MLRHLSPGYAPGGHRRVQAKKGEHLIDTQCGLDIQGDMIHVHVEERLLFSQNLLNPLLDGASAAIDVHGHGHGLTHAMASVFCLALHGRIPPAVEVENSGCVLKIEPEPTGPQGQE